MAKYNIETAVLISVILGLMLLFLFGISGIFSIIIMGFTATYLTVSTQRSFKVGGIAGVILCILIFIFGFFASPQIPDLPDLSGSKMISLELGGLFNLILGFILLIIIGVLFGSIGGSIAQKLLKKKSKPSGKYNRKNRNQSFKNNRKTLNRR